MRNSTNTMKYAINSLLLLAVIFFGLEIHARLTGSSSSYMISGFTLFVSYIFFYLQNRITDLEKRNINNSNNKL